MNEYFIQITPLLCFGEQEVYLLLKKTMKSEWQTVFLAHLRGSIEKHHPIKPFRP